MSDTPQPQPDDEPVRDVEEFPVEDEETSQPLTPIEFTRARSREIVPGLVLSLGNLPDAMAAAILMYVPPAQGLYAAVVGPIVGGMTASAQRLVITTTTAIALSVSDITFGMTGAAVTNSVLVLALIAGIIMLIFGIARLGGIVRFVSFSVMTGFLSGIAVQIILGQLGRFVGYPATGRNNLAKAVDVLMNLNQISIPSTLTGIMTIVLVVALERTRLRSFGRLIGLFVPSILIVIFSISGVQQVSSVAEIPRGFPMPQMIDFSAVPDSAIPAILTGALAVALIALIQGAGVSQATPNLDGKKINISRDFIAQGLANVTASFFQGVPVGATVSNTALSVSAGSRGRYTAIFSGVFMISFLVLFPTQVSQIAMPSLAALLIMAGIGAIRVKDAAWVWRTNNVSRATISVTFLATLFFPIQVAVAIGAALSAVLYVSQSTYDVRLVRRTRTPDGRLREGTPPPQLPNHSIVELDVYGNLFYAGARTLEEHLPKVGKAHQPMVLLRLRGDTRLGSTFMDVLARYCARLRQADGKLFLTGVDPTVSDQIVRSGKFTLDLRDDVLRIYMATPYLGESSDRAFADARAILYPTLTPNEGASASGATTMPPDAPATEKPADTPVDLPPTPPAEEPPPPPPPAPYQ